MASQIFQCPHCGSNHPTGTKFCPNTGKSVGIRCRRCRSTNLHDTKYCSECGVDLSRATFGLPVQVMEEWSAKFGDDGWKRDLTAKDLLHLGSLNTAFDGRSEYVLIRERIASDGWTIGVSAAGVSVRPKPDRNEAGVIVVTNWRVVVINYNNERAYPFLYENLTSAEVSNQGAGEYPVFSIVFGKSESIEWYRKQMPESFKGRGIVSRIILTPIQNQTLDLGERRLAERSGEILGAEQRANARLIDYFRFVIAERQRL